MGAARSSLLKARVLKVSRGDMQAVFERVELALGDDQAMRSLYQSFVQKLGWQAHANSGLQTGEGRQLPEWLPRIYRGPLEPKSLLELGMA